MVLSTLEPGIKNNLFSNYYLENLIHKKPKWNLTDHRKIFRKIKEIYEEEKNFLKDLNEPQLEERFYRKIFNIILPDFEVQLITKEQEFPDYAFFPDKKSLDSSHVNKGTKSFYRNAFAIGEVKRWDTELDKFGKDKHNKRRNPSFQIWLYLQQKYPKWGILSNGRKWRLYHQQKPLDVFYEIDLIYILEHNDVDGFKYFYYFFSNIAFTPSENGEVFIESVLKESLDYAREIGDNLKDNVYKAMEKIAKGFFHWPQNQLDPQDEKLRSEVQKSSMRLLYRILFILYAEGKGLLDLSNIKYCNHHSLRRLTREIAAKKEGPDKEYFSLASTKLWASLKDLFLLIDQGSKAFGISSNDFYIPPYNGGLFNPKKKPNLEKWVIGDTYLADAIDLLARSEVTQRSKGFVDYSTLEIRHLGSIYEGLLEYKLKIAEIDLVVSKVKNKLEWITLEKFNQKRREKKKIDDFDEFNSVHAGELYLATDKGERKSTGSYYTPDYIVNYIVVNTIGPTVKKNWKIANKEKRSFVNATKDIKILDPAMGSGHFLFGAIEFLAGKMLEGVQKDIENGLIKDDKHFSPEWAKREVLSHCIYGVDINDLAVELAKVSLWLTTISTKKPLNFLDHRLKQGNSLIGASLSDLKYYPSKKKINDQITIPSFISKLFIDHLIGKIEKLESINDENLKDIRMKEKIFEEFKCTPEYRKTKCIANVYTSFYFENKIPTNNIKDAMNRYYDLLYALKGNDFEWQNKTKRGWFIQANQIAEEKSFFHWELEFPEIFFQNGKIKENPGFDAVIGNPPYVRAEIADKKQRKYLMDSNRYKTIYGRFDVFLPFIELGLNLIKEDGNFGMIVPSALLTINYTEKLRQLLLTKFTLRSLLDLHGIRVFKEAEVSTCVPIINKKSPKNNLRTDIFTVEKSGDLSLINTLSQDIFLQLPSFSIRPDINSNEIKLKEIIDNNSITMGELCYCITGLVGHDSETGASINRLIHETPIDKTCKQYIEAKEWEGRYSHLHTQRYIEYKPQIMHRPKFKELFESKKILIQRLASGDLIQATLDCKKVYVNHVLNCCIKLEDVIHLGARLNIDLTKLHPNENYDIRFILALICSNLLGFYHNRYLSPGLDIFPETIRQLPIRKISFRTSSKQRKTLLEEIKQNYQNFLSNLNQNEILEFVDSCLPKNSRNEFIKDKEKSDVVHDLLAYLAEEIINMNKSKSQEIRYFLDWLSREIGVRLDTLSDKTKIMHYYTNKFDDLLCVLKNNRKRLMINVSNREFQENLYREFDNSKLKIVPLMEKIKATDELIDQIIYKLYGLGNDEKMIIKNRNKST